MRSPLVVVVIAVTVLAACDDSPTSPALPERRQAPAETNTLLVKSSWTVVRLPFKPRAINDEGVIVGTLAGEAVRYENGTMTILPHPAATPFDEQIAVAISKMGKILGYSGANALVWSEPTQAPLVVSPTVSGTMLDPLAIDDAGEFVAGSGDYAHVWRYAPGAGLRDITVQVGSYWSNDVNGMNAAGYAVGTASGTAGEYAVRWSANGTATILPTFSSSTVGEAINSHGDVLGWSVFGATIWRADGSFATIAELPNGTRIRGWNDAGRIAANDQSRRPFTLFNGATTYLPLLDADYPLIRGVNSCGWIIGSGSGGTGFLWKHSGLTLCDGNRLAP